MLFISNGSTTPIGTETCGLSRRILNSVFIDGKSDDICLLLRDEGQMQRLQQLQQLLPEAENKRKIVSSTLSAIDFRSFPQQRGAYSSPAALSSILTAAPARMELVEAVYQLLLHQNWTYVGLMSDASDSVAQDMVELLRQLARDDRRVCFPLVCSFTASNASLAGQQLRQFAYGAAGVRRLTVVYLGAGDTFLQLWQLVTDAAAAAADSEKRYQFVLVGDAFGSLYRMADTRTKTRFALGTVFVFPGVLDADASTDELAQLFRNITADPLSMGRFSGLRSTHARLLQLKGQTESWCSWGSFGSPCYLQALQHDLPLLALAAALSHESLIGGSSIEFARLRSSDTDLAELQGRFTFLRSFVDRGFVKFSFAQGLQHSADGSRQPIIKMYQAQLEDFELRLRKVGEVLVRGAGRPGQAYERSFQRMRFYRFFGKGDAAVAEEEPDSRSLCPSSCPQCLASTDKEMLQYQEGDIYLGALIPVHYRGSDLYDCSDGEFRAQSTGSYEMALAFKFVIDWANLLSQGRSSFPEGFDEAKMDQNFILGVRSLVESVHKLSERRLRWGYVILDTCYSAQYTVRNLARLLDGRLKIANFNSTKVVGFIGAWGSTVTMAASEVLKLYHLPLISYGSTTTELLDFYQYPYVLRTNPADTAVIRAMLSALQHYRADIVSVLYTMSDYSQSLWRSMQSMAEQQGVCIAFSSPSNCTTDTCARQLIASLKAAGSRYVFFLADIDEVKSFMEYPNIEKELGFLTLFTTEAVASSEKPFASSRNSAVGVVSVELVPEKQPAFSQYMNHLLRQMPASANQMSQWHRLHLENVHQCVLTDSFVRNSAFTRPCDQSVFNRASAIEIESWTAFAEQATATLVLGSLTAISYYCSVARTAAVCPRFFFSNESSRQERANLLVYNKAEVGQSDLPQKFAGQYDGRAWSYQKIFEQRMGRTLINVWQYRNERTAEYRFVKIGSFDGAVGEFSWPRSELLSHERQTEPSGCRTQLQCSSTSRRVCSGQKPIAPGGGDSGPLWLLGLLFFPACVIGFLVAWFTAAKVMEEAGQEPYYYSASAPNPEPPASSGGCSFDNIAMSQTTDRDCGGETHDYYEHST